MKRFKSICNSKKTNLRSWNRFHLKNSFMNFLRNFIGWRGLLSRSRPSPCSQFIFIFVLLSVTLYVPNGLRYRLLVVILFVKFIHSIFPGFIAQLKHEPSPPKDSGIGMKEKKKTACWWHIETQKQVFSIEICLKFWICEKNSQIQNFNFSSGVMVNNLISVSSCSPSLFFSFLVI